MKRETIQKIQYEDLLTNGYTTVEQKKVDKNNKEVMFYSKEFLYIELYLAFTLRTEGSRKIFNKTTNEFFFSPLNPTLLSSIGTFPFNL